MTTEYIWASYHQQLKTFIQHRVPHTEVAEDLLQNIFIKIHSELSKLQQTEKLKSWLFQIARNAITDYYRTRKPSEEINDYAEETKEISEATEDIASSIKFFILQLEEPYREAMILSEIRNLSQKQVAEKLNISYSGAKSRIQRGREKVKQLMYECCHYEFDKRGNVIDYECRQC